MSEDYGESLAKLKKLESQEKDKDLAIEITHAEGVFSAEWEAYGKFGAKLSPETPQAKQYYEKGKGEVTEYVQKIAARGQWFLEHPNGVPSWTEKPDGKVKNHPSENVDSIQSLAHELKSTLQKYQENLPILLDYEQKLHKAEMDEGFVSAAEMEEKQWNIPLGKLDQAIDECFVSYCSLKKILVNNSNLPPDFKIDQQKRVDDALTKLVDRKTQRELQKLITTKYSDYLELKHGKLMYNDAFKKLPKNKQSAIARDLASVKISIQNIIEVLSCPESEQNFWEGKALFDQGQYESAKVKLTAYKERNSSQVKQEKDGNLAKHLALTEKMLDYIEDTLKLNEDFFEGQKLLTHMDVIGAKAKLKKYVLESLSQKNGGEFVGSARTLLKQIALTQVDEVKAKLAAIKAPEEMITVEHDSTPNPYFAKYNECQTLLKKIELAINNGEYYDFTDACQALGIGKFDSKSDFDFLADETKVDEGKPGLLALARKYRDQKRYDLAEQYFIQYFGKRLQDLTIKDVSIESLRKKYYSNPKFHSEITKKVQEAKVKYNERVHQMGDTWAQANPWDETKTRTTFENAALRQIQPEEVYSRQQNLFSIDPTSLGDDRQAWEEFANMKGIHWQGSWKEPFALSDEKLDSLIQQLPVDIAIIALSGGLGAAAGGLVSEVIMTRGLSMAAREALAFGVSSGLRQFGAYGGGLLVENTVFTASSVVLHSVKEGRFTVNNLEQFSDEWKGGLITLGGLGMVGRASHALGISGEAFQSTAKAVALGKTGMRVAKYGGRTIALAAESAGMGSLNATQGAITGQEPESAFGMHDLAIVLGLKIGHIAGEKVSEKIKDKEGKTQKVYADVTMSDERFQLNEKAKALESERKTATSERKAEIDRELEGLKPKIKTEESWDQARAKIKNDPQIGEDMAYVEHYKKAGLIPKDYDPLNDLEYLKLAEERPSARAHYIANKLYALSAAKLMADSNPELHQQIVGLGHYFSEGTDISFGQEVDKVKRTHTDENNLPLDWKQSAMDADKYVPGKSLIIEMERSDGSGKRVFKVITAETFALHDWSRLVEWIPLSGIEKSSEFGKEWEKINEKTNELTDPDATLRKGRYQQVGEAGFTFHDQFEYVGKERVVAVLNLASELYALGGEDLRGKVIKNPKTGEPFYDDLSIQRYLHEKIEAKKLENKIEEHNTTDPEIHKKMMELADKVKATALGELQELNINRYVTVGGYNSLIQPRDFTLEDVIKDPKDLPPDWKENIADGGDPALFQEGKSYVLKLESEDGKIVYKVVTAQEIAEGYKPFTRVDRKGPDDAFKVHALTKDIEEAWHESPTAGKKSEAETDYLKKVAEAKAEIDQMTSPNGSPLSIKEKARLLLGRIADIRKEITEKGRRLTDVIKDYLKKIPESLALDPNSTPEKLLEALKADIQVVQNFTNEEIQKIEAAIKDAFEKSKNIARYYEAFKDRAAELFEMEFGVKPKGKVVLIKSPFGFAFQLYNIADYAYATKKDVEKSKKSGGCSLPLSNLADLRGLITLVNGDVPASLLDEVVVHEERHNVNRLIDGALNPKIVNIKIDGLPFEAEPSPEREVLEKAQIEQINKWFSQLLSQSVARAKDEIIAYMKDGSQADQITAVLTEKGGLYDYWGNPKGYADSVDNFFKSFDINQLSPQARDLIAANKVKYRDRHLAIVREAVQAAFKIGNVDELAVTPVKQWRRIAEANTPGLKVGDTVSLGTGILGKMKIESIDLNGQVIVVDQSGKMRKMFKTLEELDAEIKKAGMHSTPKDS